MKKTLSLLTALALCLTLCACAGANTPADQTPTEATAPEEVLIPKDELLSNAVELDDYETAFADNKLRAEEKYIGNAYLVTGTVVGIEETHVDIQSIVDNHSSRGVLSVALPKEDIIELTTGQKVQVVGKIASFSEEEVDMGYGFTDMVCNGAMTNGYIVTDRFEVSGVLRMYYVDLRDIDGRVHNQYGDPGAWYIGIDTTDDNILSVNLSMSDEIPVEHVAGQNITSVQFGGQELPNETKITVSAKIISGNLVEAELISVGE